MAAVRAGDGAPVRVVGRYGWRMVDVVLIHRGRNVQSALALI